MIRTGFIRQIGRHMADPGQIGADGSTEGDRRHFPVGYTPKHRAPIPFGDVLREGQRRNRQENGR